MNKKPNIQFDTSLNATINFLESLRTKDHTKIFINFDMSRKIIEEEKHHIQIGPTTTTITIIDQTDDKKVFNLPKRNKQNERKS